ncbi:hypothetical protein Poli38472_007384 [Pythium oligandrum]|uniref:Uncharacterized protein n=1 Tax=Pythium oligandrum TaxID=41045 RepID=A0A8K1CA21_PYTOL|nr:hypothetical protein Poli38472_007384 [Pythium oligandrum]|eukprot:TMW59239.1 hypothetical protein Poli38472_007384 [Pythium oligandrum]
MLLPSRVLMIVSAYLSVPVSATRFSFINQCPHEIQLWDNSQLIRIPVNAPPLVQNVARAGLMWRHGYNPEATLAEFTVIGDGKAWYDISIIPPGVSRHLIKSKIVFCVI